MKVSAAEAARLLQLDDHTVAKLLDAQILVGPISTAGRRQGVNASSLETAQSVLPVKLAEGDVAFHVSAGCAQSPPAHGRPYGGWHATESLALPPQDRRAAWGGVWKMTSARAQTLVGAQTVCSIGGFIVDVAKIEGTRRCLCCGLAVFDLIDADDTALGRYRGRRFPVVERGSLFTIGTR
jgi:hypothetical protein